MEEAEDGHLSEGGGERADELEGGVELEGGLDRGVGEGFEVAACTADFNGY